MNKNLVNLLIRNLVKGKSMNINKQKIVFYILHIIYMYYSLLIPDVTT
jgi:hypothetical protein